MQTNGKYQKGETKVINMKTEDLAVSAFRMSWPMHYLSSLAALAPKRGHISKAARGKRRRPEG
eukprot:6175358-Pleurochrysis_carterae.AAC.2